MYFFFIIWYFFQFLIGLYLIIPFVALLIYFFKKSTHTNYSISKKANLYQKDFHFAAIITAHKEIILVPALIDSLRKQSYSSFTIYVVADSCDNFSFPNDNDIIILHPENELNSKIKSIDYAIDHFIKPHDALVILDPDNLVHPNFFKTLNIYFKKGFRAVQTNLQAKNTDSIFAKLDSLGDIFYNFVEREIRMEIGFSSAIWGSGIAVATDLYKEIVYDNFLGGFDKKAQAHIVQKVTQLAFAKEAFIYDEKITNGASLQKQRTRWLHAYFKYFKLGWQTFARGIKTANLNLTFFGFFNLRPPLFILYLLGVALCVLHYWIEPWLFITWLTILIIFIFSFIIIAFLRSSDKKNIWSVFLMPLFIFYQLIALLKLRRAGKSFLKTEHTKLIYIEDLLKNESV